MALFIRNILAILAVALALPALAQEEKVRAALKKVLPDAPIDSVRKTTYGGLYEITIGSDVYYVDEKASFVLMGSLVDLNTKQNMTELRQRELLKIDFASLPLDHAFKIVRGNGSRKIAMFADPNCGYCKKFERDLQAVKDITVYTFLYPILGGDSPDKAKNIWCAKDSTKVWRQWMIDGTAIPASAGQCDTAALQRNVTLGRKYRINGTPGLVFEDGTHKPGALNAAQIEQLLAANRAKS
jgi:thiol:disulfide interchange protein DsbC